MKARWITEKLKPQRNEYVLVRTEHNEISIAKWNGYYWVLKTFGPLGIVVLRNVKEWQFLPV